MYFSKPIINKYRIYGFGVIPAPEPESRDPESWFRMTI